MAAKTKKKKSKKGNDEFKLEDVIAVGGDKEDYEMLKDVDVSGDIKFESEKDDSVEGVSKNEIASFIHRLGLDAVDIDDNIGQDEEPLSGMVDDATSNDLESKKGKEKKNKRQRKEEGPASKDTSVTDEKQTNYVMPSIPSDIEEFQLPTISLSHNKLLIRPGGHWFDKVPSNNKSSPSPPLKQLVTAFQNQAAQLMENEVNIYQKVKAGDHSSDAQWLRTVLSSGTLTDKIAALTVQIQESPVHQLKTLDSLLAMAKKKGRRESIMAVDTLKELWLSDLLPDDRKLKPFSQHPWSTLPQKVSKAGGGGQDVINRKLVMWHFEDLLKKRYLEFISVLERLLQDTLVNIRSKILGIVFEMLSEKPEQEQALLGMLVNKVGDPTRNVASKAAHLLRCMVMKHPNMKLVITKEVEKLLYRSNISSKAQYYAVCFLNQTILTKKDKELASKLIAIYFTFFKAFVKKGDEETKMLSALLMGVNRAFPYSSDEDEKYSEQLNMLFRVVHVSTFNTSVQGLMLLFQVMDSRQSISDRFYQALYTKLFDPSLRNSSKQAMFLNLLYKALKVDPSLPRVKAFIKRLLQVCAFQQPPFICGALFLISELIKLKPGIKSLTQQPEEDDDEEHFVDIPDPDENNNPGELAELESSDDNETSGGQNTEPQPADGPSRATPPSCAVRGPGSRATKYDPHHRSPLYCGAEHSCVWELTRLALHYHPSVVHFSLLLLKDDVIEYKGDPLQDFTLIRFLDRFVYKNPKKKQKDHGGSLMQPQHVSTRLNEEPVNSKNFLQRGESKIREDEIFFYKYFKRKAQEEDEKKKKRRKTGTEEEESDDGEHADVADENVDIDFDFARELKSVSVPSKKKKKGKELESDSEGDDEEGDNTDEESSDDNEFDYEDMSEEDEDELLEDGDQSKKPTDQDYEKALLENLSSDEFASDDEDERPKRKRARKTERPKGHDTSSMFAAADEFAHLLESSESSKGGGHDVRTDGASHKQLNWEQRYQNKSWKGRRPQDRGRNKGKGPNRGPQKGPRRAGRNHTRGPRR